MYIGPLTCARKHAGIACSAINHKHILTGVRVEAYAGIVRSISERHQQALFQNAMRGCDLP